MRSWAAGILGLALAVAASAQVRVAPSAALAPLGVPALLVGTPQAPAPSLAAALGVQAQALAPLPAPAAAAYLIEQAASPVPAARAAAKLNAARLAPATAEPELRQLAESAHRDPALAAWFDGGAAAPSLELDGLALKRGRWRRGGAPLRRLGQGEFGFVDEHPAVPGAVIKTVALSAMVQLMSGATPERSAALEEKTSRALAETGAGPRYLGRAEVDGVLVSVRERVFGDTVERLSAGGTLGPEEAELVRGLLRRLAAAGLKPDDMRPSNVMIGTTALDSRRRAYLVDGGNLGAFAPGLDERARYEDLLRARVVLRGRMDPNVGWVEHSTSVSEMLEQGLERASRTTRWLRFTGFCRDFLRALAP